MALPHHSYTLLFTCKSCNKTKPSSDITPELFELICKSCWTQIQREDKIKSIL